MKVSRVIERTTRMTCLALTLLLSACISDPPPITQSKVPLAVEATTVLPAPRAADFADPSRQYLIGANDRLEFTVFGIPDLSKDVQVDVAGQVNYPLAGTLEVAGKTPQQVAAMLADRLRGRYVRDPQVSVNVRDGGNQTFSIDGAVDQPGLYPVVGKMTLMRAVSSAKGTTEFAKLSDVVIFRTVDGRQMAGLYNLGAIRRGIYDDPPVYPNDVVIVGDSQAKRLSKDLLQLTPALATPLIVLLQK